jgi:hypothetical protein
VNARVLTTLTSAIALSFVLALSGQTGTPGPAKPPADTGATIAPPKGYDDVISFAAAAAATAPERVKFGTLGKLGGKDVPLVVVGTGLTDTSAAALKASPKLRIWVQAASREGTDAALMLLKDLAAGKNVLWLSSVVLLVSPMEIGDIRRTPSGREFAFLDAPEAVTLAKALADYDPHVSIEIRTEDGPCSGYAVTFSGPLNPNTSEHVLGTLREEYFPYIVRSLKTKWSMESFYRGKVVGGDDGCTVKAPEKAATAGRRGASAPPTAGRGRAGGARGTAATASPAPAVEAQQAAWQASGHQLGLVANYLGVRNRFSVVGAVHAKDTSDDRAKAASYFLEEALGFAWGANARLKKATESADAGVLVGRSLPTSTRLASVGQVEILMGDPAPGDSGPVRRRTSPSRVVSMRDQLHFEPASDEIVAAEYFVPASESAIVELLRKHGIQLRQTTQGIKGAEEFAVVPAAGSPAGRLSGTWQRSTAEIPAGSWAIRMNQPLTRLAFALLEPTSEDSVAWMPGVTIGKIYPVLRRGR